MCRRLTTLLLAAVMGWLGVGTPAASARAVQRVRYLGLSVAVPAGWRVVDLAADPQTCVRFDRHVVYFGRPASQERCPSGLIGRTEALLLQPAAGARQVSAGASLRRGRVLVTATWRSDPAAIERALGVRRLPSATGPPTPARTAAVSPVRAHASAVTTGLGFDPCATPSQSTMSAWLSSPYRTTGVYIGGANMACSQPNLTSQWVSTETAAGWHFIPTYVGLQAPGTSCGCSTITPSKAASQGAAAASDAVTRARAVGIGSGNPIYFDLEAYSTGGSHTTTALTFLSAWTTGLHAAGYVSGVYSSGASGIADLIRQIGGAQYTLPDDIWVADWNGKHTVVDPYVPADDWADHQRIHQFNGGENLTYGGVTMNVDGDYVDGATAAAGSAIPDGTFVAINGQTAVYRVAGGAPLLITSWAQFGAPQPVTYLTPTQFAGLSRTPLPGTFLSLAAAPTSTSSTSGSDGSGGAGLGGSGGSGPESVTLYRVAGGAALPVSNPALFTDTVDPIAIDPFDIAIAGRTGSHLNARPTSGTVVEGLPSGKYWTFTSAGARFATSASTATVAGAVAVDDAALSPYKIVPAPIYCIVPKLHRMSMTKVRAALSKAHCTVGVIHKPKRVPRGHTLRVHAQRPGPGQRRSNKHTVNLALL